MRKISRKFWFGGLLLLLVSLWTNNLYAEESVSFKTYVSTTTITIGDKFSYNVEILYNPDVLLDDVDPAGGLDAFEIKDYNIIGPKRKSFFSKRMVKEFIYTLSTFTTGDYTIPSLELSFTDFNGEKKTIKSGGIKITVLSVKPSENDKDDIRDIKPVIKARYPVWYYWVLLGIVLLLAGAGVGYYMYRAKKIPDFLRKQPAVVEPPHVIAFRKLKELENSDLLEKGQIKTYYIILSEIIKSYLESYFGIPLLDKTTYEVYYSLREVEIDKKVIVEIREFLEDCDLVKFAKYIPDVKEIAKNYETAVKLVEITKKEEVAEV